MPPLWLLWWREQWGGGVRQLAVMVMVSSCGVSGGDDGVAGVVSTAAAVDGGGACGCSGDGDGGIRVVRMVMMFLSVVVAVG
nr:hypothetical protein [Tanacetum cinerariifolium]